MQIALSVIVTCAASETTVTYRQVEDGGDQRHAYANQLLSAALDRTAASHGPYRLLPSPPVSYARARDPSFAAGLDNFVFEMSAHREWEKRLLPIRIPLRKGVIGYRLLLIRAQDQEHYQAITDLGQLRRLRAGQGHAWSDVEVLTGQGFRVVTGTSYEGLFAMLRAGRFDYFPRGLTEVFTEHQRYGAGQMPLAIESDLCLYYPLPRYFYTARGNEAIAARIEQGLELMIADGSFERLWWRQHGEQIAAADLSRRRILRIENPLLADDVPFARPELWYQPGGTVAVSAPGQ
ncbi:MAG: hypothetical protein ACYTF0_00660 [Planctomycetota bacterium]|jgi:hypothetical protein